MKSEIVPVDKEVEVIVPPIKISVNVNLPKDELWFWVEFDCWGQSCGTLFIDLEEALRWCVSCYDHNLNQPVSIKEGHGKEIYGPDALNDYVRERS